MPTTKSPLPVPEVLHNEYERERVPDHALKGNGAFWSLFAGAHIAGTEFIIGPLFVSWGVGAFDLIVGLLLGNLLAVLSWRYVTTRIATDVRETHFFQLEKICGRKVALVYALLGGVIGSFLGGGMISVSATALAYPIPAIVVPNYQDLLPNNLGWVALCLALGVLFTVVAYRGFGLVVKVASLAAPWMTLIFVACGVVIMTRLKSHDLWGLLQSLPKTEHRIGFWGVVSFAWLCNVTMHLGMGDMTVMRFARRPSAGWASAAGMFLGHYMAWICSALMLVYWVRAHGVDPRIGVPPGTLAMDAVGWAGIICVVLAGWTTANPSIYGCGLAMQSAFPRLKLGTATLIAGALCTLGGTIPAFLGQLLSVVGFLGTVIAPLGAVIVADHFLLPRLGLTREWARTRSKTLNPAAAIAWAVPVLIAIGCQLKWSIETFYTPLPAWLGTLVLYPLLVFALSRNPMPRPARPSLG